jgi:hypothetical protein
MISHRAMRSALEAHKKWAETATVEELRDFMNKANPPIKGLDPPLKERLDKRRRSRRKKKAKS